MKRALASLIIAGVTTLACPVGVPGPALAAATSHPRPDARGIVFTGNPHLAVDTARMFTGPVRKAHAAAVSELRKNARVRRGPCDRADWYASRTPLRDAAAVVRWYYDESMNVTGSQRPEFVRYTFMIATIRDFFSQTLPGNITVRGAIDANQDGLDDDARLRLTGPRGKAVCVSMPVTVTGRSTVTRGGCWRLEPRRAPYPKLAERFWRWTVRHGLASASRSAGSAPTGAAARRAFLRDLPTALTPSVVFAERASKVTPLGDRAEDAMRAYGQTRYTCVVLPPSRAEYVFRRSGSEEPGTWHLGRCGV